MGETRSDAWRAGRGDKWSEHLVAMEATLAPVDAPLLEALLLDAPYRVADVGCGGGGTAIAIARRAPRGTSVEGFDLAPGLVAQARARAAREDVGAVSFEIADVAEALPAVSYPRLVSRFGVMFFDAPAAAFANLARWLSPGGRFAFAVWGAPSENPWMTKVRDVVARVVDVPSAGKDAPGPFRYAGIDRLTTLLSDAGFVDVAVTGWRGLLPIGGGLGTKAAARFALRSYASFSELLAEAGEGAFERAERALMRAFEGELHGGIVRMGATVRIVTGSRG